MLKLKAYKNTNLGLYIYIYIYIYIIYYVYIYYLYIYIYIYICILYIMYIMPLSQQYGIINLSMSYILKILLYFNLLFFSYIFFILYIKTNVRENQIWTKGIKTQELQKKIYK